MNSRSTNIGSAPGHDDDPLEALRRDLRAAGLRVGSLHKVGGGRSAMTAMTELETPQGSRRVAVRAEVPAGDGLPLGSLADLYLLLERLHQAGVRAPAPVSVSEGSEGGTYAFLVTEFIQGDVPQPWRRAGRETVRALRDGGRFGPDFVENLARIHAVRAGSLPPGIVNDADAAATSHPARSRQRSLSWIESSAVFAHDPVLTYTLLWLEHHQVADTFMAGLVHGDYRIGNLVVRDDLVAGVLDWELAEAGEVLSDVAWLCGPQGLIDGFAGGLFTEDGLVRQYESASGRSVPADLFAYLKVEGTLRTASVWARLSGSEARRNHHALARRCQDSVLSLIGQCARSLDLPDHPQADARTRQLLQGLTHTSEAIASDLTRESPDGFLGPAARSAQLVLRRVVELTSGGPYGDYAAACEALLSQTGEDAHDDGATLAERVCRALRSMSRRDPGVLASSEVRALVGWSAQPGIAFANQMITTAQQHDPELTDD